MKYLEVWKTSSTINDWKEKSSKTLTSHTAFTLEKISPPTISNLNIYEVI